MKPRQAIDLYVAFRKSAGADFRSSERVLATFCGSVAKDANIADVDEEQVAVVSSRERRLRPILASKAFRPAWVLPVRGEPRLYQPVASSNGSSEAAPSRHSLYLQSG